MLNFLFGSGYLCYGFGDSLLNSEDFCGDDVGGGRDEE